MVQRLSLPVVIALLASGCGSSPPEESPRATPSAASATQPRTLVSGAATPIAQHAAPIPVLLPDRAMAPERDDSAALRAHLLKLRRQAMQLAREASTAPRSAAGGCVFARPTMAGPPPSKMWLPKPPAHVSAQMLGRQVQVDVTLPPGGSSAACRVAALTFVVSSGRATTFNNLGAVADYSLIAERRALLGRTVRLVGRIPYGGVPPYRLSVNTANVVGQRSPYVEMPLRCPAGSPCQRGERPSPQHALPEPHLPVREAPPQSLAASFRQVLQGEPTWVKATGVTCANTSVCTVDFYDSVSRAPMRLRYAVQGEQRPGCWLAMPVPGQGPARDTTPSAFDRLGGCVDWTG